MLGGGRVGRSGQVPGHAESRVGPHLHGLEGGRGVQVVGERGEHRLDDRPGRGARSQGERLAPGLDRVHGVPELVVGRCGSGGAAAPVGSPSGRPRCDATPRRTPGCPSTSTSSRRRRPPSRRGRGALANRSPGGPPAPRPRTSRGGEHQVAATGLHVEGVPEVLQGDRGALDASRAGRLRRGLSHDGSPGRSPRHTMQSSGSLAGAVGVASRSPKISSIRARSQPDTPPKAGSAVTEK